MIKINPLSPLNIGIDVNSKSNYVCAWNFYKNKLFNSSFFNNQPDAEKLVAKIIECLKDPPDIYTVVANFAAGIVAEIDDITAIHSSATLAKYASLCWRSS